MDQELHWGGWWEGRAEEGIHKGIISNTKHLWKTHGRPVLIVGKTLPWEGILGYIKWRKWAITSLYSSSCFLIIVVTWQPFQAPVVSFAPPWRAFFTFELWGWTYSFSLGLFSSGYFVPAKGKETKTMGLVHLSLEIIFIFNVYYTSGSLWCDHSPPVKPSSPSLAYWQVGRLRIMLPFSNVVN